MKKSCQRIKYKKNDLNKVQQEKEEQTMVE